MATKGQDTLASGAWDSAGGGPGARGMIAAFAERQWRLGEKLSYSGIEAIDLGGGDAAVVARFADGTVQPARGGTRTRARIITSPARAARRRQITPRAYGTPHASARAGPWPRALTQDGAAQLSRKVILGLARSLAT